MLVILMSNFLLRMPSADGFECFGPRRFSPPWLSHCIRTADHPVINWFSSINSKKQKTRFSPVLSSFLANICLIICNVFKILVIEALANFKLHPPNSFQMKPLIHPNWWNLQKKIVKISSLPSAVSQLMYKIVVDQGTKMGKIKTWYNDSGKKSDLI